MRNPTLTITTFLFGIVLASAIASQVEATSKPGTTSKPHKPDDEAQKQARRWVTFLELDDRRAEAANALLKMGAKAVPALVQALNDPRPVVAQRVCHILRFGSHAAAAKERLIALSNSNDPKLVIAARYALADIQPVGITLVSSYTNNKILELDEAGQVVLTLTEVKGPWDVDRLPNSNYLICSYKDNRVVEMTAKGKVVWSFAKLKSPRTAQRLPNGNTLIADYGGRRVLEVDRAGKTVWKYDKGGVVPRDAERLVDGNTLILDHRELVIEVTAKGEIVWDHRFRRIAHDADRLPSGNTLIAIASPGKVIEVTPKGKVVWELKGLPGLLDADRLPNGHTLVAQAGEVAAYDAKGKKVWSAKAPHPIEVNRY